MKEPLLAARMKKRRRRKFSLDQGPLRGGLFLMRRYEAVRLKAD